MAQPPVARKSSEEDEAKPPPEIPPDVVSTSDFPGSIPIPGTDAAVRFGARLRAAFVFTLAPLGTDDRFLTHSIPVDDSDAAGEGKRTNFSARASRFNIEYRTPTGIGQVRAFIEGDFAGAGNAFRLRHAYAQYHGFIVGQTWSTFADPEASPEDIDFEGVSSENLIRQAQVRYIWRFGETRRIAVAAETPEVSLTGGEGVNLVPDLVGRHTWRLAKDSHVQAAVVLRQIRGESDALPGDVEKEMAGGFSVSGAFPFHHWNLTDRFIFQVNGGIGIARYINDLNSLGGQDAVFDPDTGDLEPLPVLGWFLAYEHMWKHWETTRSMNLRSSIVWSFVAIDNADFQPPEAYKRTQRFVANLVFSPSPRVDVGIEWIQGQRMNLDGERGSSSQIQFVTLFRF